MADARPADADAAKRSAGETRRRAIPVPTSGAAPAAAETPEPGEVVDAAVAAPAAQKRAADRDDKPPGESARSRGAGATKKAPDQAAADKKEAAKSGAAVHAEKAREPRAGRAKNAEQKPEKPEKAPAADGKDSSRSSRDGGVTKEKVAETAAPSRKDTEQVSNHLMQYPHAASDQLHADLADGMIGMQGSFSGAACMQKQLLVCTSLAEGLAGNEGFCSLRTGEAEEGSGGRGAWAAARAAAARAQRESSKPAAWAVQHLHKTHMS